MSKTLAQIAVQAYCDELSRGSDSMNVASDLEPYEVRCIEAAANAIIEECAKALESEAAKVDPRDDRVEKESAFEIAAGYVRALKTRAKGGEE